MKLFHTCLALLAILGGGVRAKSVGRLKHHPAMLQQSVIAPPHVSDPVAADTPSAASMHPSIEDDDPFYDDDWDIQDLEESEGQGAGIGEEEEEGEQLGDGDRALLEALRRRYKDDPRLSPAAAAAVAAGQAPEIFDFEDFTMARNDDPSVLFPDFSPVLAVSDVSVRVPPADVPAFASPNIPFATGKDEEGRLSRVRRHPLSSDVKEDSTDDESDALVFDLIPRVEAGGGEATAPDVPPLPSPATVLVPAAQATAPAAVHSVPQPEPVPAPELNEDRFVNLVLHQDAAPIPAPVHVHSPHFVVVHTHDSAPHGIQLSGGEEEEQTKSLLRKGVIESSETEGESPTDAEVADARPPLPPSPPQLTQAHIDALFDLLSNFAHIPPSVAYVPISADFTAPAPRVVYDDQPTAPDTDRTARAVNDYAPPPVVAEPRAAAGAQFPLLKLLSAGMGAGAGAGAGAKVATEETELERALRRQRTIEKLIHAVKIAGHVESYLTNRARTAFKTLAHVYDLDYDERQRRARSRGRSFT